jgi:hypothetical protein
MLAVRLGRQDLRLLVCRFRTYIVVYLIGSNERLHLRTIYDQIKGRYSDRRPTRAWICNPSDLRFVFARVVVVRV